MIPYRNIHDSVRFIKIFSNQVYDSIFLVYSLAAAN